MISKPLSVHRQGGGEPYGVRKRLLEYDDVMNAQRDVIYKQRRETSHEQRMGVNIMNKIFDTVAGIVEDNRDSANYAQFKEDLLVLCLSIPRWTRETSKVENEQKLAESVFAESMEAFKRKTAKIADCIPCHQEGI